MSHITADVTADLGIIAAVYLNGEIVDRPYAINLAEGYVDVYIDDAPMGEKERRYGSVEMRITSWNLPDYMPALIDAGRAASADGYGRGIERERKSNA